MSWSILSRWCQILPTKPTLLDHPRSVFHFHLLTISFNPRWDHVATGASSAAALFSQLLLKYENTLVIWANSRAPTLLIFYDSGISPCIGHWLKNVATATVTILQSKYRRKRETAMSFILSLPRCSTTFCWLSRLSVELWFVLALIFSFSSCSCFHYLYLKVLSRVSEFVSVGTLYHNHEGLQQDLNVVFHLLNDSMQR